MTAQPASASRRPARKRTGKAKKVTAKFRLWIVFDERVKFGVGRAELLELIDELGSIKHAVAQIGMSYRAVWGYLRELESAAGFKFLERTPGSGPRSGARLTEEAKAFLRRYQLFMARVERGVETAFKRSFQS
jgi:molybdate transport system regulatory protein